VIVRHQELTARFTKAEPRQAAEGGRGSLLLRPGERRKEQWVVRGRLGDDGEVLLAVLLGIVVL
jgi:hypothetical protein